MPTRLLIKLLSMFHVLECCFPLTLVSIDSEDYLADLLQRCLSNQLYIKALNGHQANFQNPWNHNQLCFYSISTSTVRLSITAHFVNCFKFPECLDIKIDMSKYLISEYYTKISSTGSRIQVGVDISLEWFHLF